MSFVVTVGAIPNVLQVVGVYGWLSSHDLPELGRLGDRVLLICRGSDGQGGEIVLTVLHRWDSAKLTPQELVDVTIWAARYFHTLSRHAEWEA